MRIQLSAHFSYGKLLRFTLSTILMLICTSMYSIVDGFFVSNYVGKTAFAAVNLIYPVSMGVTAIGFMLGTGGSAIVSKTLGQGTGSLPTATFPSSSMSPSARARCSAGCALPSRRR